MYDKGIVEYNSGSYGDRAAMSLGCLAKYANDADIKREANIALRYFSRLYAGNFVSADTSDRGMVFGGPQSRNSNIVHSKGGSDIFYRMFTGMEQSFFNRHAAWELSAEDRALYQQKNRTLLYKCGSTPDHFVVHYVGSKVSMGSAGTPFGNDDKTHVINFFDTRPGRQAVVHISSVTEGRSDPYGGNRRHFRDYLAARAQRLIPSGSEMVFLIAADGSDRGDTTALNHYTILPANRHDGMWIGNTRVPDLEKNASQALADNGTLFIRFGDVAAGIRYLAARDINGSDVLPQIRLVNTPAPAQSISAGDAMYIHAQLSNSRPPQGSCGVIAAWWRVKEGITTDAEFTAFRNEMINARVEFSQVGDEYTLRVTAPDGLLGISGNKTTKQRTASYGDNVLTLQPGQNFTVNGTDIAPAIFAGSTYINKGAE